MQYVILGLLQLTGPQSLYSLRKMFAQGISLFYSASLGSIQRSLIGLAEQGLVSVERTSVGGREKKLHTVTEVGREAWRTWMRQPITGSDPETAMLSKVYFLGLFTDPAERRGIVDVIRHRVDTDLDDLRGFAADIDSRPVPDEYAAIAAYQRATLHYGIRAHETAVAWLESIAGGPDER